MYKKVMSGRPVPCRLPHAIVTKMVSLTEWKRFVMNAPMSFRSIPDSSFNSILRKALVVVLKGRFGAEEALKKLELPPGVSSAA